MTQNLLSQLSIIAVDMHNMILGSVFFILFTAFCFYIIFQIVESQDKPKEINIDKLNSNLEKTLEEIAKSKQQNNMQRAFAKEKVNMEESMRLFDLHQEIVKKEIEETLAQIEFDKIFGATENMKNLKINNPNLYNSCFETYKDLKRKGELPKK